ncbi:hypothetical protein BaRGS_00031097 [Batillaria attramentaria]|uniref:Uncharacterized protein n=1 Tax=Batillaria attramentaria TaxID=370345 RepID=A0ABD0JRI7_9CAEN
MVTHYSNETIHTDNLRDVSAPPPQPPPAKLTPNLLKGSGLFNMFLYYAYAKTTKRPLQYGSNRSVWHTTARFEYHHQSGLVPMAKTFVSHCPTAPPRPFKTGRPAGCNLSKLRQNRDTTQLVTDSLSSRGIDQANLRVLLKLAGTECEQKFKGGNEMFGVFIH